MDKFKINGPSKLTGNVSISGSKNAALPIMVACIAYPGIYTLNNVPNLRDTRTMAKLIETIGGKVKKNVNQLIIDTLDCDNPEAPYELVKTMRASFYVLGPLLSRFDYAKVSLPGGCAWGPRPVDFHIKAFEEMGAEISLDEGYILAKGKLHSNKIHFKIPSVGATGNVLMGCVNLEDTLTITNAAKEPEIVDLCNFLIKIGVKIAGVGTSTLKIKGISKKDTQARKITYDIISDRIEAGTFLMAAAITGSKITLDNIVTDHLKAVLGKLKDSGSEILVTGNDSITIDATQTLKPVNVTTDVFPGFPTDLQPQWITLMTLASGVSIITDNVYFDRFSHIPELIRMGAKITLDKNIAKVEGVGSLKGAKVMAGDLRAGASLVLAALKSKEETIISRIYHIDRGYESFEEKLQSLNVDIVRLN